MGKNIVLLSDGTGNAASSPFKTNVWRVYQALDIEPAPDGVTPQIALYDNGVGTETFKPLALMGLALGLGVAANVKNLYTFLCRNYQAGDRIYLFGFSRGAFTVRVLSGLILRCGVVSAPDDAELNRRVKTAYAEYKRDVARRATANRPWLVAGRVLGGWQRGQGTRRIEFGFDQAFPDIEFIGVWDTVDAYGMPVDELKEGIDRYVWPMTLADRQLSDRVHRACHALSLDDERPTFRPVLWNDVTVRPERLSQVWFAGVHANVGGGYPDDGLSCTALRWMMDEAALSGLRFFDDLREEYRDQINPNGTQYDSRSGLAGYYRYGPRDVDRLCDDPDHGVKVALPAIHDAVMARISQRQVAYAPVSFPALPRGYALMGRSPTGALEKLQPVEQPQDIADRATDMEPVYDAIFRKRVAYLATVFSTLVLVLLPLFDWIATRKSLAVPAWIEGLGIVPGWVSPWIASFARHPAVALIFGFIALWLFVRTSALLQQEIAARAEYAWRRVRPNAGLVRAPARTSTDKFVRALRTSPRLVAAYRWITLRMIPLLFALLVALPIGLSILPFFAPKFSRNLRRRKAYKVKLQPR
jgi:uncharacterized protein (DUF2235 family)